MSDRHALDELYQLYIDRHITSSEYVSARADVLEHLRTPATNTGEHEVTTTTHTASDGKRVAIYTRTARHDERAHEAQELLCEQHVRRHLDVDDRSVMVYGDTSSERRDRDGLANMLAAVMRDEIDVVVTSSLDRISRSAADFARTIAVLDEHDCTLVSVNDDIDTATPMGRAIISLASAFAQIEREGAR